MNPTPNVQAASNRRDVLPNSTKEPSVAYTMQLDPVLGILDLRYHGVVSVAQRRQAATEAVPLLRDSGVRRILIDLMQATAAPDTIDDFRAFAAHITREPLFLQSRTAFVAPPVNYTNHLIEVLVDAHHYPFSRFSERAQAIAWLLGDEPTSGLRD
ncbi:MAG: hypothetical protein JWL98_964 [Xanthomonadaceae bacterium]|nr:hypothetical protein [Xanthomonadaceae bacterium]